MTKIGKKAAQDFFSYLLFSFEQVDRSRITKIKIIIYNSDKQKNTTPNSFKTQSENRICYMINLTRCVVFDLVHYRITNVAALPGVADY
jgi:hypothetical protein